LERSGYVSYANCGLPYYIGGVIEKESSLLLQTPESLHKRFNLDVRTQSEVVQIDTKSKSVKVRSLSTQEEHEMPYDKLVLSPGATPIVPPIKGIERAFTLRTVEDTKKIHDQVIKEPKSAVVIGGGFIGLEMVENLVHRGIPTTLVEASNQVLAPLDPEMSILVAEELRKHGVDVRLNATAVEVLESSVRLSDGGSVSGDLVILAIGVRPDTKLASMAQLEIGARGGILVNDFGQTSNGDIYALGDAVEKTDALDDSASLIPLANIANRQGRLIADHLCGTKVRAVKSIGTAIVKVFDLAVAVTGWNEKRLRAAGITYETVHIHPGSHAGYFPGAETMSLKLLFSPDTGEIFGAQGIGKDGVDKRIDVIATAIRGGIKAQELLELELAYAPPFGSAKDPVNMLGYIANNIVNGTTKFAQWHEIDEYAKNGYVLLDVRTPEECARGTIPNFLNIPVDEIRARHHEIKSKKVLVTCQVGQRGHTATMLLKNLGFEAVNLDGGYLLWSKTQI
jgi:NADPH-dependent 2,4-dienoyl-CoA reductase/sulfur reductase-like enzyme/rhodanese-related sulfurtransferase